MGHRLRLSGPANEDIRSIWEYTRSTYDYEQAIAYSELLEQAIRDVVADPERPSSISRPELGTGVRSYHIALSKFRSGMGIKSRQGQFHMRKFQIAAGGGDGFCMISVA